MTYMTFMTQVRRETELQDAKDYLKLMIEARADKEHLKWCMRQVRLAKRRLSYTKQQLAKRIAARRFPPVTSFNDCRP